jgi:hypothetical protein
MVICGKQLKLFRFDRHKRLIAQHHKALIPRRCPCCGRLLLTACDLRGIPMIQFGERRGIVGDPFLRLVIESLLARRAVDLHTGWIRISKAGQLAINLSVLDRAIAGTTTSQPGIGQHTRWPKNSYDSGLPALRLKDGHLDSAISRRGRTPVAPLSIWLTTTETSRCTELSGTTVSGASLQRFQKQPRQHAAAP